MIPQQVMNKKKVSNFNKKKSEGIYLHYPFPITMPLPLSKCNVNYLKFIKYSQINTSKYIDASALMVKVLFFKRPKFVISL